MSYQAVLEVKQERREFHLEWVVAVARMTRRLERHCAEARFLRELARGHLRALREKHAEIAELVSLHNSSR